MIVTIDGPTASGKSTVARMLAKKLGFYYLNTGMLYRALAYLLINHCGYKSTDLPDPKQVDVARCLDPQKLVYCYEPDGSVRITFAGEYITPHLKMSEIDRASSLVSANQMVREQLLQFQRWYGQQYDVVAEGRDLGSVVFPDADYKFFLSASIKERACRWQADRARQGEQFSLEQSIEKVTVRDKRDQERAISPLKVSEDAIEIDNSDLSLDQTVEQMFAFIKK